MLSTHRLGLLASAFALTSALAVADTAQAPAAAPAEAAAPVAEGPVTVNGVTISQQKIDSMVKQAVESGQQDTPDLRRNIRDNLITSAILAQEAAKRGLEKDQDVQNNLEMARAMVLSRALISAHIKANPIDDKKLEAKYEEIKPQITSKEVKARHILVKTEAEAKKILADLKKGKKFEDLAKKHSNDPGSKENGGDLGWGNPDNYVPEFSQALATLENGQITPAPVKSSFGYHVIQKQDQRENAPSLEQIKPQLKRQMEGELVENYIKSLRDTATIK